jgi:hypothetical protein
MSADDCFAHELPTFARSQGRRRMNRPYYTVAIERSEVRLADQDDPVPMALRVTHIFRRERSEWKLMLRLADPLIGKTTRDSVLLKQ